MVLRQQSLAVQSIFYLIYNNDTMVRTVLGEAALYLAERMPYPLSAGKATVLN